MLFPVRRTLTIAVPLSALLVLGAPAMASVAATTTSGVRCTIVGTGGADHLQGTSGRDVICGRGGSDTIVGLGGNDVIDAGSGNDVIDGGSGDDTLTGGSGRDTINGGSGTDTESGGSGDDVIYGGAGQDLILGQSGNDDLNGQSGADTLDGGSGTDWCTIGSGDTEKSCVYDRTAPSADLPSLALSDAAIDVTKADRQVQVSVRLRDDTGVASAETALFAGDQFTPYVSLRLTSGTVRDGIWSGPITLHRYAKPGSFYVGVRATDRIGRPYEDLNTAHQLTVKDATPDTQPPVVRSIALPSGTIDTRTKDNSVTFTAHITDDASGVSTPEGCVYAPGAPPEWVAQQCQPMTRTKGSAADGTWKVTVPLPKGSIGGTWNAGVWVQDALLTNGEQYYLGSDIYAWQQRYPSSRDHELAGARFAVLGSTDTHAARFTAVKVSRTSVDTLTSDQTVDLYVHAQDAKGEGVTAVSAYVEPVDAANAQVWIRTDNVTLHQGDAIDGWWRVTVSFPRGTPPGAYRLGQVIVQDRVHWTSWVTADKLSGDLKAFPAGSLLTTGGAAWDGTITVVANPAG